MDLWVKWDYLLAYSTDKCKKKQTSILPIYRFTFPLGHRSYSPLCRVAVSLGEGEPIFLCCAGLAGRGLPVWGGKQRGSCCCQVLFATAIETGGVWPNYPTIYYWFGSCAVPKILFITASAKEQLIDEKSDLILVSIAIPSCCRSRLCCTEQGLKDLCA